MTKKPTTVFIGDTLQKFTNRSVAGEYVDFLGEQYYKISNYDAIEPFFMSIVSCSDHWLFISSTGGLTAGRVNAEQSLFPYYTVDKISENSDNTGNKSIFLIGRSERTSLWEPFSDRQNGNYSIVRNLYKNVSGSALVFEEQNLELEMTYRYAWRTSEKFGFVKSSWLQNDGKTKTRVEVLDGLQNVLPANVTSVTQNTFGSLLDAYKRSELIPDIGLAIFTLNSRLTDLAEPSESLLATTIAQVGLRGTKTLLSSIQLDRFRLGDGVETEYEIRGRRGAFFVNGTFNLAGGKKKAWHLVADVSQDSSAIVQKIAWLAMSPAECIREVEEDIKAGETGLWKIVASADGLQISENEVYSAHHFANVLFNDMRGGVFADEYWLRAKEFIDFVSTRNHAVVRENPDFFAGLPSRLQIHELKMLAEKTRSSDLIRMSLAYLPLIFSRRHGDPSRPWNRFSINIKNPNGSLRIDYEGNWRDIFQNWEALAYSFPGFIENMIATFLNATTTDGYNPYRISQSGVDWEIPEPGNPWANIGYWSDHQIIYLLKLMEISHQVHPGELQKFMDRPVFSYAQVPYQIKTYTDILKDPYRTIIFDWDLQRKIERRVSELGTDGKLVPTATGQVVKVSLAEKILTLLLAKITNFVPEGGIWMNTQRPEWNDANNALVGKGLSVVTLCYLRRFIEFCRKLFVDNIGQEVTIHKELEQLYTRIRQILERYQPALQGAFDDETRRRMMDDLGEAGSDYRWGFYLHGFSEEQIRVKVDGIIAFLDLAQRYIEHSLRANKRSDDLYHAYNILHLEDKRASISTLYEMLEGQAAILSSGMLTGLEALALLQSLRRSALYQPEQHSYILYPNQRVKSFLEKNCLTEDQVDGIGLLLKLENNGDMSLTVKDVNGIHHFNGQIRNARDVTEILEALGRKPEYAVLALEDGGKVLALFEATFQHKNFTGRSGTFFAYEGLGSVYWHMVTKLMLAVQETIWKARGEACLPALIERYEDIRTGLGYNKSPADYGTFPTDPYSHTPKGQGAKQPGMSGQVKEEILAREAELGLSVERGRLVFDMLLLNRHELLTAPGVFIYLDVNGQTQQIRVKKGAMAYTICQTPIIIAASRKAGIAIHLTNGTIHNIVGKTLDLSNSEHILLRDGVVHHLTVSFPE